MTSFYSQVLRIGIAAEGEHIKKYPSCLVELDYFADRRQWLPMFFQFFILIEVKTLEITSYQSVSFNKPKIFQLEVGILNSCSSRKYLPPNRL